jgi:arylsulfatase A-like enzyme
LNSAELPEFQTSPLLCHAHPQLGSPVCARFGGIPKAEVMQRPNLILLTVECWRADHLGPPTPHLVQLAQESAFFSGAQTSGGWTKISMTALMSSAYASMHGGPEIAMATPARRALAECLLDKGYWTGGFTANPACGSSAGFHRGFGNYRDARRDIPLPPDAPTNWKSEWPRLLEMGIPPRDTQTFVDARELTDLGLRWIENRHREEPWFLWLHYLDPHWPCQMAARPSTPGALRDAWHDVDVFRNRILPSRGTFDPGEEVRLRWARRYRECLTATDTEIGRLLGELRTRPDWDRTIVTVTGDHGEEFFERGTWHHSWNQLHREGIHVPLIIRVPASLPQCLREPVGLLDLAPTLLDFAEIEPPSTMMGHSLRPMMEGQPHAAHPVFTEMMGHLGSVAYRLAIRDGEWKYIYDFENPHNSKLFQISEDPNERVNMRDRCSGVFRRFEEMRFAHVTLGLTSLMQRLRPSVERIGPAGSGAGRTEPSPDDLASAADGIMREQLEALGYL